MSRVCGRGRWSPVSSARSRAVGRLLEASLLLGICGVPSSGLATAPPTDDVIRGLPGPEREPSSVERGQTETDSDRPTDAGAPAILPGVDASAGTTDGELLTAAEDLAMLAFEGLMSDGRRAEEAERWGEAVRVYEQALTIIDNDPQALRGLAHARVRQGDEACPRQAVEDLLLLEVYDPRNLWLRERVSALAWMARCGDRYHAERLRISLEVAELPLDDDRRLEDVDLLAAGLLWAKVQRLDGVPREQLTAQLRELLDRQALARERRGVPAGSDELALRFDVEASEGRISAALDAFEALARVFPDGPETAARRGTAEELEIERSIEALAQARGGRPTEAAQAAFVRGREALLRGDGAAAERHLRAAVDASPWFPRAQYELGQLLARAGKFTESVAFLRRATLMEPTDYRAHMALGLVCFKEFKGARDEVAAKHLGVALRLRPDLYQLHFYLGELRARETGEDARERARDHFRTFIEVAPSDDPLLDGAREALRDLERTVEDADPLANLARPPRAELERLEPELQRLIDEAFVVGAEYGDWERAQRLLLEARAQFPGVPALLNELAKVSLALENEADALAYWEESLARQEDQPEVHERLATLVSDAAVADRHWTRAADLGSLRARFQLARRAFDGLRLLEARRELDRYLVAAGPYELDWEQAQALSGRLRGRLAWSVGGLALLLTVALGWGTRHLYLRRRGDSLAQLMDAAPKAVPEVARILSLIRHEVLKHNTSFLVDVGEALIRGDAGAAERARTLFRRLFEDEGTQRGELTSRERLGIYGRFLGYCAELEQVGAAHGRHLNLRRRDPVFSALLVAFARVHRRSRHLRSGGGGLRELARRRLGQHLREDGRVLGREASEQIATMVEARCVSQVDLAFLRRVFEQVSREPKFSGLDIEIVATHDDLACVRIFPSDLEDVLVNLMRNSLASSMTYIEGTITVGIGLHREFDDITGLETLVMSVLDRSPEPLTDEMLRGRYADRGMGITADLLSRYDGAVSVESRAGWSKAVVVRFFCVEETS